MSVQLRSEEVIACSEAEVGVQESDRVEVIEEDVSNVTIFYHQHKSRLA